MEKITWLQYDDKTWIGSIRGKLLVDEAFIIIDFQSEYHLYHTQPSKQKFIAKNNSFFELQNLDIKI